MGPALAAIAAIALVGLGFLVGRGPADARRTYLYVVSGISLLVLALGVVTALFGIVEVALPGSVRSGGERGGGVQIMRVGPGGRGGGAAIRVPGMDDGAPMFAQGPRMRIDTGSVATGPIRSRGIVALLRGIILALVAGAILRYHWPLATEALPAPPVETTPPATRRRRSTDS